VLAQVNTV
jgi:anaphase-promoting complex subunit 8